MISITNKIKNNLGISISVAILSGLWALLSEQLGVLPWAGFLGWSIFFFAGADLDAAKKTLPPIILGPILAFMTSYAQSVFGSTGLTAALIVFVLGFAMTIAQAFSLFEVAAATFISANVYFASGDLFNAIVVVAFGLVLGLASIKLGEFFDSLILADQ